MQGVERRGLQGHPGEFKSRNDHDRPETADVTYIEPLTAEILELIIEKERPDAILPTMGGQTALNLAVELAEKGILEKYQIELIGAKLPAIKKAEDRNCSKKRWENRPRSPQKRCSDQPERRTGGYRTDRVSCDTQTCVHARSTGGASPITSKNIRNSWIKV